jgi:hypothetical protein
MSERLTKKVLPVTLTEKELVELGSKVSEIHSRLAQERLDLKSITEAHKNRIGGLQEDLSDIMTKLRTKKEYREVDCLEVKDFENKVINYIYMDEVVETCPLTDADRQITIF